MTASRLSIGHLERLTEALQTQNAPVISRLNPGLEESKIDEILVEAGIDLPAEPRLWWGWHNGASLRDDDEPGRNAWAIGPDLRLLTLNEALEDRSREMATAAEVNPDDPESWWKASWLPFTSSPIAIDCAPSGDGCCAIRNTDPMWDAYNRGPQVTASLGELVEIWIYALTHRVWFWDPDAGQYGTWKQNDALVTAELRETSQF